MSAHASQAFSMYTSARDCTYSEHLPTKVPGPFRSVERKFEGARRPGSKRGRELNGQEAKVTGSKLARVLLAASLEGTNWPESEKAVNRQYDRRMAVSMSPLQSHKCVIINTRRK